MTRHRDHGMVTAEVAVLAPVAVAFLAVAVWLVSLALTQVRLVDAARDGARLVARGDSWAMAEAEVRRSAPRHAEVAVSNGGDFVRVDVRLATRSPLPSIAGPLLSASAQVRRE